MPFKKQRVEDIDRKLRETEVVLEGGTTLNACQWLSISEQTFYR